MDTLKKLKEKVVGKTESPSKTKIYNDKLNKIKNKKIAITAKKEISSGLRDRRVPIFITTILTQVASVVVLFGIGASVIYSARVAQSNILPTCIFNEPYTSFKPKLIQTTVDFNGISITDKNGNDTNNSKSTKIIFPIGENMEMMNKGLLFRMLRPMVNPNNFISNPITYFIGTVIQKSCAQHFNIVNIIYNIINDYFSDTFIIIFSPFIYLFVLFFPPIINFWIIIYEWFKNIGLLDKTKYNNKWESHSFISNIWIYIWSRCISILLLFIGVIPLFAIFLTTLFTIMFSIIPYTNFIKSEYKDDSDKKYGVFKTFKDLFLNKAWLIAYILSYFVIIDTSEIFGSYSALIVVIVCVFFWIFTSLYNTNNPSKLSYITPGLVGVGQTPRSCVPPKDFIDKLLDALKDIYDCQISKLQIMFPFLSDYTEDNDLPRTKPIIPPTIASEETKSYPNSDRKPLIEVPIYK